MRVQSVNLNLIPTGVMPIVHLSQYDRDADGALLFNIFNGPTPFNLTGYTATINGTKPDGNVYTYPCTVHSNFLTSAVYDQMTTVQGTHEAEIRLSDGDSVVGTLNFQMAIEKAGVSEINVSHTDVPALLENIQASVDEAEYWAEQAASSVTGVASFNGRGGSVLPMAGDYNSDMIPHTMSSSIQPIGGIQPGETVISKRIINTLASEVEANAAKISTKADKTDLTSIIATGSTNATGSTITNGKYFYLNGTLVRAKADIANGASFTLNTNYEVVTAGGLNDIYNRCSKKKYTGTTRAQLATAVSSLTFDVLCHSVLVVNSGEILTFYDWSTLRTRWMRFNYDTSNSILYSTVMVNSSVDGITTGIRRTSSFDTSTAAITSWALYY